MKRAFLFVFAAVSLIASFQMPAFAISETDLILPDLNQALFFGSVSGSTLLSGGLIIAGLGLVFGLVIYKRLQNMPVHPSMKEISELIYETCKTYLLTQGKFLMILELFIVSAIIFYFGFLRHLDFVKVATIIL